MDYELRCTWRPELLSAAASPSWVTNCKPGVDRLLVQECRPTGLAAALSPIPPERHDGIGELAGRFEYFALRPAQ